MTFRQFSYFFIFICNVLFFSYPAKAAEATLCKAQNFLVNGFCLASFNNCSAMLKKCPPTEDALANEVCAKKVVNNNVACNQLNELAHYLKAQPAMINAKQVDDDVLVEVLSPVDGQHKFYVINSKGCMVDTTIDPRQLDEIVRNEYSKKNFLILNLDEPEYRESGNIQSYIVPLRIADSCLACPTIATAKVRIDFIDQGKRVRTSLEEFKPAQTIN